MTDSPDLMAIAQEVRSFLEPEWQEWRRDRRIVEPSIVSYSMCRLSSAVLVAILRERMTDRTWEVVGGSPLVDSEPGDIDLARPLGGILDIDGHWRGHYWVVSDQNELVDITADQFGLDAVIVDRADNPRFSGNYRPKALKSHLSDAMIGKTKGLWLGKWDCRDNLESDGLAL